MNINNYSDLLRYLYDCRDESYRNFTFKLLKNHNINLIGVRTPILKRVAKYLSKRNYSEFINISHSSYEEILIHGLILGYLNVNFNDLIVYIHDFIPYIDNWAVCDLTVSNLKAFRVNQGSGFRFINKCIKSKNFLEQRFGVVLLNSYYINDDYISDVLDILSNIKTNEYYLQMAIAWCLSSCYVKYPDLIIKLLIDNKLDVFIHNKTIQKIVESIRVDDDSKDILKKLKIKA